MRLTTDKLVYLILCVHETACGGRIIVHTHTCQHVPSLKHVSTHRQIHTCTLACTCTHNTHTPLPPPPHTHSLTHTHIKCTCHPFNTHPPYSTPHSPHTQIHPPTPAPTYTQWIGSDFSTSPSLTYHLLISPVRFLPKLKALICHSVQSKCNVSNYRRLCKQADLG